MAEIKKVIVPDIGGATDVEVIDLAVKPGDILQAEDTMITLESEKASMDIPAPFAGTVKEIKVKLGDKVSEGGLILTLEAGDVDSGGAEKEKTEKKVEEKKQTVEEKTQEVEVKETQSPSVISADVHAGPAVRRLANELGVDLHTVSGTGRKGRVTQEDIHRHLKGLLQGKGGAGLNIAAIPQVDFSKFGETETQPLSRIKKLSGANLHRNWVSIPHITQFEEADITDLEDFRQDNKDAFSQQGIKLTPVVFILKAVAASLKAYPQFNASLDQSGENLILKKYFHIGVAVDTPNGLVVPVIRDVDQKGLTELAQELGTLSKKAREGKLMPTDMQGGCFSISSLGGIGGTAFTPIINAPEVAILGVSRSEIKAQWIEGEFEPRLMLPLSLSYDHRVIDGADGARFVTHLANGLTDLRKLLF